METRIARRRGPRQHPRYYAVWDYAPPEPVLPTSDHARRLRRWGFATGLVIVLAAAAFAWGIIVLTHAGPAIPSSPPVSTLVAHTPASH